MKGKPMKRGKADRITYGILAAAALFLVLAWALDAMLPAYGALVCFAGALVFRLICWRCPACGGYLWRNRTEPCQHCGAKLEQ